MSPFDETLLDDEGLDALQDVGARPEPLERLPLRSPERGRGVQGGQRVEIGAEEAEGGCGAGHGAVPLGGIRWALSEERGWPASASSSSPSPAT